MACAAGKVAPTAWDDAFDEGVKTTCHPNICAKDESVTNGVCAACTAGKRLSFTTDNAATKCYVIATGLVTGGTDCSGAACDTETKCNALGATHRWGTDATANGGNTACVWKSCKENQFWTGTACDNCASGKTAAGDACFKADGQAFGQHLWQRRRHWH